MAVVFMMEWDNPKDEARYKKFSEFQSWRKGLTEKYKEYVETMNKMNQEGTLKFNGWTDNTGHIIGWWEFESIESFGKLWVVEEWHKWTIEFNHLVDNLHFRLLRPVQMLTEDLIP